MMQQKRLDVLWRLAGDVSLDDRAFVRGLLTIGAALLVPGQAFGARFGRVLGSRIAIEDADDDRLPAERAAAAGIVRVDAYYGEAIRRLVTCHWDAADHGALLITPFNAGHALYVLALSAAGPAQRPLTADDDAFAETIATLIASRVQKKWDSVAERDPLEVVTLTGAAS